MLNTNVANKPVRPILPNQRRSVNALRRSRYGVVTQLTEARSLPSPPHEPHTSENRSPFPHRIACESSDKANAPRQSYTNTTRIDIGLTHRRIFPFRLTNCLLPPTGSR